MTNSIRLQRIWSAWKKFGQAIGDIVARVVLTVFYFTVLAPFGVGVRLFGDPLQLADRAGGVGWRSRREADTNLEAARRQF